MQIHKGNAEREDAADSENVQYAALPYTIDDRGNVKVLLVTSRETGRWVLPKGWPIKGRKPYESAAREAYEEAGVVGKPAKRSIGTYHYWKRLESFFCLCRVEVYPLAVERLEAAWPEEADRKRLWFDLETAAMLVDEPSLESLIGSFQAALRKAR